MTQDRENVITLPDNETMLRRLRAVNDEQHLRQKFYPLLLKDAGRELVPQGVVMMFVLAISDYIKGMPPMMETLMLMRADEYIDALIVDNEDAATEAKEFLKVALQK